ncbi:MAG: RsmB/NOP family class I SAM-dependent RNA methyltransferase [Sphaerochaetaceae bacterium]
MESFDTYYASIYLDRYKELKEALLSEREPVEVKEGLLKGYFMDEGSLMASSALPVKPGDRVLDMCAAPGGKSLILATKLKGEGSLILNDRSRARRERLKRVIAEHLSSDVSQIIKITGHDARKWGLYEQACYDAVLLDAPCSSERHLLANARLLKEWSPSRGKRLANDQFAFLAAALESVTLGGFILYSTCSINPLENEAVIAKLFKRRLGRAVEVTPMPLIGEKREYGQIILPDRANGRGPLYYALLRRIK